MMPFLIWCCQLIIETGLCVTSANASNTDQGIRTGFLNGSGSWACVYKIKKLTKSLRQLFYIRLLKIPHTPPGLGHLCVRPRG